MTINMNTMLKAFAAHKYGDTPVTCPDGTHVTVVPCADYGSPRSYKDCTFFLVYADPTCPSWLGGRKLEEVIDQLNRMAELKAEANAEKSRLRAFFDTHEANGWDADSWSWYSDWHKDLYGYRPHGHVCGEYVRPY